MFPTLRRCGYNSDRPTPRRSPIMRWERLPNGAWVRSTCLTCTGARSLTTADGTVTTTVYDETIPVGETVPIGLPLIETMTAPDALTATRISDQSGADRGGVDRDLHRGHPR